MFLQNSHCDEIEVVQVGIDRVIVCVEKYSFKNSVTKKGATNAAMMTKRSEEQKMTTHGATALRTIHVVEDDSLVRDTISATLRAEGYTVLAFAGESLPSEITHDTSFSLILLDATLPSPRIFALCRQLHRSSAMEPGLQATSSCTHLDLDKPIC